MTQLKRKPLVLACAVVLTGLFLSAALAEAEPGTASHSQTQIIKIEEKPLNAICLDSQDHLLVAVGNDPGKILRLDPLGQVVSAWDVPIKPEAVAAGQAGTVYVAGSGKMLKLANGKVLLSGQAPHAAAVEDNTAQLREQVVAQAKRQSEIFERQIKVFQDRIAALRDKGEEQLTDLEKRQLQAYQRSIESYKQVLQQNPGFGKMTEEQIDAQVKRMAAAKIKFSSISVSGEDVFVSCPAMVGYGFEVWRLDDRFENAKNIVGQLRGCCGQMDVKASGSGVFVAENSRHRVVRYDREGEMVTSWGERARTGVTGFGSCCNPMNVAFGPNGEVYTAEATSGRIKRYSPDGELLGLIGSVEIVPGCKNVTIAVNRDGSRAYMMDLTRNHILLMEKRTDLTANE